MKIWYKFYECSCSAEGIMVSKEDIDDPYIYLAIFRNNFYKAYHLSFIGKMRAIWAIMRGQLWNDNIILDKKTAKALGKTLMHFGESK